MFGLSHLALRESFNARLTLCVILIATSQFNFGFDNQGFASTQAMDAFDRQFGSYDEEKGTWLIPTTWLSYFNSFTYLGQASGVLIGSYVSKRFGRRCCMFYMSLWALVTATIVITSRTREQILTGRVLNYIYIGMELSVVPVFQSEVTPPKARGFIVATYQSALYFGGLIINLVARGTGDIQSNAAWRIPFGLFYIIPTIVASCIWFIPESPRWLVMKDRIEDAKENLRLLRQGKFTEEEINFELAMIVAAVEREQEKGTFLDIFKGTNLRRTGIVIGANFFLQGTGQLFTALYGAVFVKELGTINPFTVTVTIATVNTATAILAMVLMDKVGRRKLLFYGAGIQTAALLAMGGLGTVKNPSFNIKSGIVAMMIVFTHGYSAGWAPVSHTLSPEIPNLKTRDMTYRTASVFNIAIQFAVSFSLPYLLNAPYANLKSKVGFIFGAIAAVSLPFAFFCVPETKALSLEELDRLFEAHTATRQFQVAKVELRQEIRAKVDGEVGIDLRERV